MDTHILPPLSATDLVIRTLALNEHNLTVEARELTVDVEAYREMAIAGIHEIAKLTKMLNKAREVIAGLRDELRRYTSDQIGRAA